MNEKEFLDLIHRSQQDKCTDAEKRLLEKWLENRQESQIFGKLTPEEQEEMLSNVSAGLFKKINPDLHKQRQFPRPTGISMRTIYRIAASVLLIALIGYGAYVFEFQKTGGSPVATVNDFTPGGDKAVLKLADGTQIELESTGTESIPPQGVARIRNESGQIAYSAADASAKKAQATGDAAEVLYNMIITPRGGQYQIRLADGSRVWLNAASSLRYPTAFSGTERVIELTGEAYFEIAENEASPFKVRMSSGAEIQVLGTHFNVMAYPEEGPMKTTLLEGSVRLAKGMVTGILKPGQQAQLSNEGALVMIKDYDVEEAVAWKNGKFVFNDTPLDAIMRQVSRWYDVDVTLEDDLRALQFGGVVSRGENASAVLSLLELTGEVDFQIQGRKIIVKSVNK